MNDLQETDETNYDCGTQGKDNRENESPKETAFRKHSRFLWRRTPKQQFHDPTGCVTDIRHDPVKDDHNYPENWWIGNSEIAMEKYFRDQPENDDRNAGAQSGSSDDEVVGNPPGLPPQDGFTAGKRR
jgi:hypothetical protein